MVPLIERDRNDTKPTSEAYTSATDRLPYKQRVSREQKEC